MDVNRDPEMPEGLDEVLEALRRWEKRLRRRVLIGALIIAIGVLIYLLV